MKPVPLKMGVESEFVFVDDTGQYLDADNSDYALFSAVVDAFPAHEGDDVYLDCKSLERFPKRCYVEGFERHDRQGRTVETLPKGLEIRTLPHASVNGVIAEFRQTYTEVMRLAGRLGLAPVLVSRHPFKTVLEILSHQDEVEGSVRSDSELALARRAMFTHGMHVNVSFDGSCAADLARILEKVNFYLPALIPWSFSSPFVGGQVFEGLCARNFLRAESRSMTDIHERRGALVLEFRGFDACGDSRLLDALLRLFCGFLRDESLPGRASRQDPEQIKRASLLGFGDPELKQQGRRVLHAAREALDVGEDSLALLDGMLEANDSYAARMKRRFSETGCIMDCISGQYDY